VHVNFNEIKFVLLSLGEFGNANRVGLESRVVRQSLVELFGDVGHSRVQQLQSLVKADIQGVEGSSLAGLVVRLHYGLDGFEVDICKLLLPEIVQSVYHITEFVIDEVLVGALDQQVELSKNPLVSEGQFASFDTLG